MTNKPKIDWLRVVVLIALTVPVLRYSVAFQQVEPPLDLFGWELDISPLTGLAFGLSYEAAIYLGIQEAISSRKRKGKKWWWPLVGAGAQAVVGVFIILPVIASELHGVPLASLLGNFAGWLWSGVVSASTLLVFATVSLASAVKLKPKKTSGTTAKPAAQFPCKFPGCDYVAKNQHALNAHKRKHSNGKGKKESVELIREKQGVKEGGAL